MLWAFGPDRGDRASVRIEKKKFWPNIFLTALSVKNNRFGRFVGRNSFRFLKKSGRFVGRYFFKNKALHNKKTSCEGFFATSFWIVP
jgi:hypothetical protein